MKEQSRKKSYAFSEYFKKEKTANPTKTFSIKILRAWNCRRKFIKNFLPEKSKGTT